MTPRPSTRMRCLEPASLAVGLNGEKECRLAGGRTEPAGSRLVTTLSWDLVGGDPAPGDPRAFDQLAGSLSETAEHAKPEGRIPSEARANLWSGRERCLDSCLAR